MVSSSKARRGGFLIVAEAGEGGGKTTVVKALVETLRREGFDVVQTREPGGSPSAELIRNLVLTGETDRFSGMTEVLLFAAARVEHLRQTILPALEAGKVVVCDRMLGSTLAYQGAGHGIPRETIQTIHNLTTDGLTPDLTLWFDVPPEVGLARSTKRLAAAGSNEDRFERLGLGFHERVGTEFARMAHAAGWARIDATLPLPEVIREAERIAVAALRGLEARCA